MIEWLEDITGPNIQERDSIQRAEVLINKKLSRAKRADWPANRRETPFVKFPILRFKWEKVYG